MSARHTFSFAAAVAAATLVAGVAYAQGGLPAKCEIVLEISNWQSTKTERGYFTNRVDLRNKAAGKVSVNHVYTGAGAIFSPPVDLLPGAWTRREVARTSGYNLPNEIRNATQLTCIEFP